MNTDDKNKTLPISSLLNGDNCSFAALYKKAHSIQEIDRNLKKLLDPSLKDKFELANINADAAILLVSSSAWATRLRYNIPAILNAFNKQLNFTSIKTVRIKIKKSVFENSAVIKITKVEITVWVSSCKSVIKYVKVVLSEGNID